ncbi:hypothetical protein GCM10007977_032770 [Dactylosporangium sucinum]|uniref:Uncharacterized protein n=1 Tax=Dactylosporangium sucinum TaxID=1424081 RepID=A0A917TMG6_9ACTN|nr:hypothetical protein GCM10007977_032770 [Dactylosporangium sucinum]
MAGVAGCAAGYLAVWVYLAHPIAGRVYSWLTAAGALAAIVVLARRPGYRAIMRAVDVAAPLILLFVVTLFLVTAVFSCTKNPVMTSLNNACHLSGLTGDNRVPQIFAHNLLNRQPRAIIWDWQGSARPPLQSGAVLMQLPLAGAGDWRRLSYESLGVLLQVMVLPAMWGVLRFLRLSGWRIAVVLTMFVFTGFFVFQSVFVWPKLIAAALVLTALMLLFFNRPNPWLWLLGGAAAGLGMLGHTGVAFTLLPMGLLLVLLKRYRRSWGHILRAALGAAAVFLPWMAYQRLFDPPGDQLLKWHFAGIWQPSPTPADPSFGELFEQSYGGLTLGQIVDFKIYNFAYLIGHGYGGGELAGRGAPAELRSAEMFVVLYGLALFNLAFVLLLVPMLRRRLAGIADVSRLKLMAVISAITLVVWPIALYGPGGIGTTAATFQGSYAMMAMLYAVLGTILTVLPRRVLVPLALLQVAYTVVVWFLLVWWRHNLHWSYVPFALLGGAATLAGFWYAGRRLDASPDGAEGAPDGAALPARTG